MTSQMIEQMAMEPVQQQVEIDALRYRCGEFAKQVNAYRNAHEAIMLVAANPVAFAPQIQTFLDSTKPRATGAEVVS